MDMRRVVWLKNFCLNSWKHIPKRNWTKRPYFQVYCDGNRGGIGCCGCMNNYYNDNCTKFCQPINNFTCDSNGETTFLNTTFLVFSRQSTTFLIYSLILKTRNDVRVKYHKSRCIQVTKFVSRTTTTRVAMSIVFLHLNTTVLKTGPESVWDGGPEINVMCKLPAHQVGFNRHSFLS
mgnify:CR=1 FL=1